MLHRRHIHRGLLAASLALALSACGKTGTPTATPIAADQAYAVLAAEGKGFAVGAADAKPVYVLFDPQCPHCGHLWQAALPLLDKARFVWLPVAFIGPKSLPQGAALMQAAQPLDAMSAHEQSLLAGQGGTAASASIPPEVEAAIEHNTALLGRLGGESVPYIVAQPGARPVTQAGALDTDGLARLIGLN